MIKVQSSKWTTIVQIINPIVITQTHLVARIVTDLIIIDMKAVRETRGHQRVGFLAILIFTVIQTDALLMPVANLNGILNNNLKPHLH